MPNPEEEKALLKKLEEYGKVCKYNASLLPEDIMQELDEYYDNPGNITTSDMRSLINTMKKMAETKDFSDIDSLSLGTISIMASKAYYYANDNYDNLVQPERCLDPIYRRGLELASATSSLPPKEQKAAQAASEEMNEIVMQNTLKIEHTNALHNIQTNLKLDDKKIIAMSDKHRLEQATIAKTLFMTHLGNMFTMQKDGRSAEFNGSVADSMAHGGRTLFLLPKGDPKKCKEFQNYFFNTKFGDKDYGTAVTGRFAASHSVDEGKNAVSGGSYKEGTSTTFTGNYQMNPAIGGLANNFGNKPILNDGRNGQVFLQVHPGDNKKGGYLMVGLENEASMTTGRTGHFHSPTASEGKFSCFMASKGGPGASKNGRIVDLSMYKPEELNAILEQFNKSYKDLQYKAAGYLNSGFKGDVSNEEMSEAEEKLEQVNAMLCGKIMTKELFLDMMNTLGVPNELRTVGDNPVSFKMDEVLRNNSTRSKEVFAQQNTLADIKLDAKRAKLGVEKINLNVDSEDEIYEEAPGIQRLLNTLNKAKGRKLDFTSESDKMARIKMQLGDITDACSRKQLSTAEAHKAFTNLYKSCADYVNDPTKNQSNDRMKAVKAVFLYTGNELSKLGLSQKEKMDLIDSVVLKNQEPKKEAVKENNAPTEALTH